MRAPLLLLLAVSCCFAATRSVAAEDKSESKAADQDRYVVLISVDGLAASYLHDPKAEIPTLRKLMEQGATADGMIASFPSVTWPSHTSLITGTHPARHGVIGNGVWSRDKNRPLTYIGDPELTKDQAIRAATLYDVAHDAGYKTASVIWPCSNGAKSLDWVIPDSNKPELHARFTTPGFVEELGAAAVDISQLGKWGWAKERSTERDIVYTQVANYLLEKRKVNLLLVHLITPDGVEHNYGPHTREAYQAVAESDQRIGEIWKTLQQPPFAGKSTIMVVSDHGFAPYDKFIRPNVAFKEMGLVATDDGGKVTERKAWCVGQGGSAFIYLLDGEAKTDERKNEVRKKLESLEGVTAVLGPEKFAALGLPTPDKNSEAPDFVLTTGPGYSFNDGVTGDVVGTAGGPKGTHGHDPAPPYMHASFIAAGAGIKPGVRLEKINNVDVAPTIAHLLGLKLEQADGRVLREILQ